MSFGRSLATPEARARQAQTDFIEESVKKVQEHFGAICNELGQICRKNSRLRDKYDNMAQMCLKYANSEPEPLKKHITRFAERLSAIQDYRQAQIDRMENKVIAPLATYATECKHTQSNLRNSIRTRSKEVKQQDRVETLRNKSASSQQALTQAEAELQRRTVEVERTTRTLEETIDKFETKKLHDLKQMLSEFVKIEMIFHAKALEHYTTAYNDLQNIEEEEQIEVFRNTLRPTTSMQDRMDLARTTAGMTISEQANASRSDQPQPAAKPRSVLKQAPEHDYDHTEEDEDDYGSEEDSEEYDDDDDYEESEEEEGDEVEELPQRRAKGAPTKPW